MSEQEIRSKVAYRLCFELKLFARYKKRLTGLEMTNTGLVLIAGLNSW